MPRRRGGTTGRRPAAGGAGYDSFLNDLWEKDKKKGITTTTTKTPPSSGGVVAVTKPVVVEKKKPAAPTQSAFDARPSPHIALSGGDGGEEKGTEGSTLGQLLSSQNSLEDGKAADANIPAKIEKDDKKDVFDDAPPQAASPLPVKIEKIAGGASKADDTPVTISSLPQKTEEGGKSAKMDDKKKDFLEKDSSLATKKATSGAPIPSTSFPATKSKAITTPATTKTLSSTLLPMKAENNSDTKKAIPSATTKTQSAPAPAATTASPSTENTNAKIEKMTKNVQTKVSTIISSVNKKTESLTTSSKLSIPTTSKSPSSMPATTKLSVPSSSTKSNAVLPVTKVQSHNDDNEPCEPSFAYDNTASSPLQNEETEDLLPSYAEKGNSNRNIPLKQFPSHHHQRQPPSYNPLHAATSLLGLLYARLIYHCTYHRTESILAFLFTCSLLLMVHHISSSSTMNKKVKYVDPFLHSKIDSNLSHIHTKLDLHIGDVDHWCIAGDNDSCTCEDPTEPSFGDRDNWMKAHKRNQEYAQLIGNAGGSKGVKGEDIEQWDDDWEREWDDDFGTKPEEEEEEEEELELLKENGYDEYGNEIKKVEGKNTQPSSSSIQSGNIDVVFLGDSITEQRQGTAIGNIVEEWSGIKTVFEKQFTRDKGGKFEGVALGIAGDTSPNLLWRIVNGEIPDNLNPSVFWITIGTNDFKNTQCSEEIVLLGILRIVEEIQYRKPSAIIVINSILPMSTDSSGLLESKSRFHSIRSGRIDFWPSIQSVNEELEKFASEQHGVKFFDANKVFVEERSDGTYIVNGSMMSDYIHPSKEGHKIWGKAISEKLETIFNKQEGSV